MFKDSASSMSADLRVRILLSVQRALLGEITLEMRAIEVEWSPKRVLLRVFTHGEASEGAQEDFDAVVVSQVVADFAYPESGDPRVECEFVRCDEPAQVPVCGTLVFARAGVTTSSHPATS